jgi:hypothetical protein
MGGNPGPPYRCRLTSADARGCQPESVCDFSLNILVDNEPKNNLGALPAKYHQVCNQAKCPGSSEQLERRKSSPRPNKPEPLPVARVANSRSPTHALMVIRHRKTSLLWLLLLLLSTASSQPDEECHKSINDDMYDFSALAGDHTLSRTRPSPPTDMLDTLRFDICKELRLLDDVPQGDQVRIPTPLRSALSDYQRSVPAGRGPVSPRRTSEKGSQIEYLPSFPLRRSQICSQNMRCCIVRLSSIAWGVYWFTLRISQPTRCQNHATRALIPLIHHNRACTAVICPQPILRDSRVRARARVI